MYTYIYVWNMCVLSNIVVVDARKRKMEQERWICFVLTSFPQVHMHLSQKEQFLQEFVNRERERRGEAKIVLFFGIHHWDCEKSGGGGGAD